MRSLTALLSAALLLAAPVMASPAKSEAGRQLEFGVKMALKGSWREAAFRFEKTIRLDPESRAAHNNLGVALEGIGEFEKAVAAYKRALELDPDNARIRENLDRLEAYLESRVRPQKPPSGIAAPARTAPAPARGEAPADPNGPPGRPGGSGGR